MTRKARTAAALGAVVVAQLLVAQEVSMRSTAAAPKLVALTEGSCAQVSQGDVVRFEWNPAFSNPAAVTGMKNFSLSFAREGEERSVRRGHGGVVLTAVPPRSQDVPRLADAIRPEPNGFFQMNFRVVTGEPGAYRLLDAQAAAETLPGYQGEMPRMTNSPVGSAFCLDVVDARVGRGSR